MICYADCLYTYVCMFCFVFSKNKIKSAVKIHVDSVDALRFDIDGTANNPRLSTPPSSSSSSSSEEERTFGEQQSQLLGLSSSASSPHRYDSDDDDHDVVSACADRLTGIMDRSIFFGHITHDQMVRYLNNTYSVLLIPTLVDNIGDITMKRWFPHASPYVLIHRARALVYDRCNPYDAIHCRLRTDIRINDDEVQRAKELHSMFLTTAGFPIDFTCVLIDFIFRNPIKH